MVKRQKTMAIEQWRTHLTEEDKKKKYFEWKAKGIERRYSENWCRVTFSRNFGSWPRKDWDKEYGQVRTGTR
jgi:hypothetical protein